MKTLTQKQTYPIAPGILLVLLVLACLRVMPLLAQESSLLLPPRQPSELLLPALESALSQPTKGSSSFLKSQSFEVREAAKQHKAGHDNAPRRLKSAASTVSQTQNSSGKTQTPFPTVGALPLAAQKPVVPATALNAAGQNASAFKEVLQYDSTGLFALKLVRVPVLDNVPNTDSATNALPPVNLPPFPVSADKTAAPDSRTTLPLSQASQPLPNTTNASNADNVKHNPGEGAALAAIGATPKLGSPVAEKHESQQAVVQQKASSPATNPLLVLPSSHPSAVGAKAPIAPVEQSQAKKTQPQLATASKAPAPAMKNNSFDLSSAAMEYVAGGSIPEGKNVPASDKPVPSLKSDNKSPWFARLPQDDFLIGFDNEEEIGRAQSSIFLGPNGEVRDLPPQTKYVPLPSAGMTLPKEMQADGNSEPTSEATSESETKRSETEHSETELAASLPRPSVTSLRNGSAARTVSLPNAPKQVEQVAQQPKPEKTDFLAKLSFGKIKMGSKTAKAEKPLDRKTAQRQANSPEKETSAHTSGHVAKETSSGKSVTSLFSGLNPFAKKKTR